MILELGIAAAALVGGGGITAIVASDRRRFPRPVYGALVSWWYGGFADNTAALMSATMLDSDFNCDAFEPTCGYGYRSETELYHKALKLEIRVGHYGRASVRIQCDVKGWIDVPVTAYDDYYIAKAFYRWKERKKEVAHHLTHKTAANLLEYRINQNYISMIEMIEKKILNSGQDTASELRAMLPPPDMPKPALVGPQGATGSSTEAEKAIDSIIDELDSLSTKKKSVATTSTGTQHAPRNTQRTPTPRKKAKQYEEMYGSNHGGSIPSSGL